VLPALLQVAREPGDSDDGERAQAIFEARRAAVRGLLRRMASGQPPLQEQALAQMANLGPIAVEGLIHALKFDDDAVADEAADCLATLGPDVLPSLLSALGERNPRHIERCAQVVARIGPPALEPLLAIIAEPGHRDRVRATTALSGLGAEAGPAWPTLLALLDDPAPQMPLAAALSLGRLTPPDDASLDALLAAHARQSAMVSRLLLPALVRGLVLRITPGAPDGPARLEQLRALGPEAVVELGRLRDDADPSLSAAAGRVAALLASP
jgi:HEAT repeat protein